MLISFRTKINVHHSACTRKVENREGASLGPATYETIRQSAGFPRSALWQLQEDQIASNVEEFDALIPPRYEQRGALLIRPITSAVGTGTLPASAVVSRRFRRELKTSSERDRRARDGFEISSLLFDASDWARLASDITRQIVSTRISDSENVFSKASLKDLSLLELELIPSRPTAIGNCAPATFAMIDSLMRGKRAIFGLESFADDQEFLRAYADAMAFLPPLLRSNLSLAAGFAVVLPSALIQWIDRKVTPPRAGLIGAVMAQMSANTMGDEACARLFDERTIKEWVIDRGGKYGARPDPFSCEAKRRLASILSSAFAASHSSSPLRGFHRHNIATKDRDWAVAGIPCGSPGGSNNSIRAQDSCYFERETCYNDFKVSTELLQRSENAADLADKIAEIDATLADARLLARREGWHPRLQEIARTAISALRRATIDKPNSDVQQNSTFLIAIANSIHCLEILSTLVKAEDSAVRHGIEAALSSTSLLRRRFADMEEHALARLLRVTICSAQEAGRGGGASVRDMKSSLLRR